MYTGISELYKFTHLYCSCLIDYNNCKWWQFRKKSIIKSGMDYYYPLMVGEINSLGQSKSCTCKIDKEGNLTIDNACYWHGK